jgi:hypothetical protein
VSTGGSITVSAEVGIEEVSIADAAMPFRAPYDRNLSPEEIFASAAAAPSLLAQMPSSPRSS